MRKLLAAAVLCAAVCFGISGVQLLRADKTGSTQLIALLIIGIACAGLVVAALLAFRNPSMDDFNYGLLDSLPEGPKSVVENVLMIGMGLLIAGVTLKGVLSGAVRPMVTRGPFVKVHDEPLLFLFEATAWLVAAWLVGWVAPRWVARR